MEIRQNLTTVNRTEKTRRDIKFIVIHFTGNNGDTAYANTSYFKSENRGASAHYFVDETEVWQCVKDNDVAWHCGTKGIYYHPQCRNANSIGIEMCNSVTRNETVETNTVSLTKYLMTKYNIPVEHVVRHYDVTHKQCPEPFVRNPELWDEFKNRLTEEEIDMEELNALKAQVAELAAKVEQLQNPMIYHYIDENMPNWARNTVQSLLDKGYLKGNENGELGLNETMLRILVILDRQETFK